MEVGVDADAPLDYAAIHIFPNKNRYEAFVSREKQSEKVEAGLLEHLLLHIPEISGLYAKGFDSNFDLRLPEHLHGAEWFSKSTVKRFFQAVGFPDLLKTINAIVDEMSQLEESKRFHLSLYGKDHQDQPEVNMPLFNASKNELIRAMDLRLEALSKDLVANFSNVFGDSCIPKDMAHLAKFSQHFGATNLEHSLCKFIELNEESQAIDFANNKTTCDMMNEDGNMAIKNHQISKPVHSVTPVKYGVSPAKVAQIERQSSSESEESSYSSDEGERSTERSRTLIRSASPRRSASPMRRVQIGRAGPRRAAAITIKSLNLFPARERPTSYRDNCANVCEEEVCEKPYKKPEIDVRRITVQDAISIFESKQRDQEQIADIQKRRSLTNVSINTNKSVLRRWSAGMGETSVQNQPEIVAEDPVPSNDMADVEISKNSEVEVRTEFVSENQINNEISESDVKSERQESKDSYTVDEHGETSPNKGEEVFRKLAASAEWNQKKQAEFNQILKKMMESKSVKHGKSQPSRSQNLPREQRGCSYDHYKEKRDAKLRVENAGKQVEKEAQFRAMQQILDKRKAEMASKNVNASKKIPARKPQKSTRSSTQPANTAKETSKPSVTKKLTSKTSPIPATRKSWSSIPSPSAGISPAKIQSGISSTNTTPTRRKPQPTASVPQPSPQKEKSQQRNRNEKETPVDSGRSIKNDKKQPLITKKSKTMKTKETTASGATSAPSKISLYNKGTKKSSVVPLESKPFLRRGSGNCRGAGNLNKKKISPQLEESLGKSGSPIEDQESELVVNASDLASQHSDRDIVTPAHENAPAESESLINSHLISGEKETLDQAPVEVGNIFTNAEVSPLIIKTQEESTISPSAWVEIEEEGHPQLPKPCDDVTFQPASLADIAPARSASPRVRHSLSQMLQEESSEPETSEWGNAEHPPAMIYQKDAPKGLKRLLKFARKSKGDANSSGWSSPSVFSEGEDDAEESKISTKRNADNLLRKAALNAKSYGQPKSSLYEGYERNLGESNLSKLDGKGSNKMQEGCDSVAGPTTKASRSFFSLSAFRGSKPSEAKFH